MKFEANSGSQAPGGESYCMHCTYHLDFHGPSLRCPSLADIERAVKVMANEAAAAQGVDFTDHIAALPKLTHADAPALLAKAASIMAERGKQYDKPEGERSMGRAVAAFNTITGQDLSEAEGWLLLQVLKDVRQWQRPGYHADSAEDCIAYAALKAEAKQGEAR
jgi:hypothetical protein